MRAIIAILTLAGVCALRAADEEPAAPDLSDIKVLNQYLQSEADALRWPSAILKKEAGAQKDNGRVFAYCVMTVESLDRLDAALLVLKAAVIFGNAACANAHLDRACATVKTPRGIGRLFIPVELLGRIGGDIDGGANVSQDLRKELCAKCDWKDLDRLVDGEPAVQPVAQPAAQPAAEAKPKAGAPREMLAEVVLKDGRRIRCAATAETGDAYAISDDTGRFIRLRKADVEGIVWPKDVSSR